MQIFAFWPALSINFEYLIELILASNLIFWLSLAMISDLRDRRIPNACCLGVVALWPAQAALTGLPHAAGALAAAAVTFGAGMLAWRRGYLGGGDVKLLSVLATWAGLSSLVPFLLVTAVLGGFLAIAWVLLRRTSLAVPSGLALRLSRAGFPMLPGTSQSLPYGVAVGLGGLWLTHRLFHP